jgi:hypothetical protein
LRQRIIDILEIGDCKDIRWFESSKLLIPGNPKQGGGDTWKDRRLPVEVRESSEEKCHFGISGLRRPEDGSDRAFDP